MIRFTTGRKSRGTGAGRRLHAVPDGGWGTTVRGVPMDHKEATVRPVDATHRGRSAGLDKLGRKLLTSALVLLPLSGCSLAFVDGPSSTPPPSGNVCTTSYAAPTLDLLGVPATFLLGFGFGGFERSLEAVAPDDDDTFGNLEKASWRLPRRCLSPAFTDWSKSGGVGAQGRPAGVRHSCRTISTTDSPAPCPTVAYQPGGASTLPSNLVSPGFIAPLLIRDVAPRDARVSGGRRMLRQCGVATPDGIQPGQDCSLARPGDCPPLKGPTTANVLVCRPAAARVGAALFLGFAAVACGEPTAPQPPVAEDPVTIAGTRPATGDLSTEHLNMARGFELAVKLVARVTGMSLIGQAPAMGGRAIPIPQVPTISVVTSTIPTTDIPRFHS